jgi:hypothetical protein
MPAEWGRVGERNVRRPTECGESLAESQHQHKPRQVS